MRTPLISSPYTDKTCPLPLRLLARTRRARTASSPSSLPSSSFAAAFCQAEAGYAARFRKRDRDYAPTIRRNLLPFSRLEIASQSDPNNSPEFQFRTFSNNEFRGIWKFPSISSFRSFFLRIAADLSGNGRMPKTREKATFYGR